MNTIESITLEYRQGSSDKVYQAAIEPKDAGFAVTFAYGRRGSTLTAGTKTSGIVTYAEAKLAFDKLVREKISKGYKLMGHLPSYTAPVNPDDTGTRPQLLNPVDEDTANMLVRHPGWCSQEKYDGRRMLLHRVGNNVVAINRKGLRIGAPTEFILAAMAIRAEFLLDGEAVGETFHAFDLLELDGQDLRPLSLWKRLEALDNLLGGRDRGAIRIVLTARAKWEKEAMLAMLEGERREGIVFKHLDEPYVPGRPASGGSQMKFKFVQTASCIVSGLNAKRSVSLSLLKDGEEVPAGNVAIPLNQEIPFVGAVVEVRYLYAILESGCLYQPVFVGARDDIEQSECLVRQLKFKTAREKLTA